MVLIGSATNLDVAWNDPYIIPPNPLKTKKD